MDVAGLVVGVAGLVGTFSACVECFELVRVGKHLGPDYETAVVKLDLLRLRFTRWGEVVGISQDDESTAVATLKSNLGSPDQDFPVVEKTVGLIFKLFQDSLETSNKMKIKSSKKEIAAASESTITNKTIEHLHEKLRKLALDRQKKSALLQKVSWALYRKRDLTNLIEDLAGLITDLAEVAPPKRQEELCIREVSAIDRDDDVAMLDNILSEPVGEKEQLDSALHTEIAKVIEDKRGQMDRINWKRTAIGENAVVDVGMRVSADYKGAVSDRPTSYSVEDTSIGKGATFTMGNRYGFGGK